MSAQHSTQVQILKTAYKVLNDLFYLISYSVRPSFTFTTWGSFFISNIIILLATTSNTLHLLFPFLRTFFTQIYVDSLTSFRHSSYHTIVTGLVWKLNILINKKYLSCNLTCLTPFSSYPILFFHRAF